MNKKKRNMEKPKMNIVRDQYISLITYEGIKKEVRRIAQEKGVSISKYVERLIVEDLKKEGVSVVLKMEKRVV